MPFATIDHDGVTIVEADPNGTVMRRPDDAGRVLEACFSARTDRALLYPRNLTAGFFDLSSGEAGVILDKLRRFHIRLAIVCAPGTVTFSSRFAELRADDLRVFESREDACAWLRGALEVR
jgi:uncharacterized protein DUF4180